MIHKRLKSLEIYFYLTNNKQYVHSFQIHLYFKTNIIFKNANFPDHTTMDCKMRTEEENDNSLKIIHISISYDIFSALNLC